MEQKIRFFKPIELYDQPFGVQCNSDYIPTLGEIIIFYPYPFLRHSIIGDGYSTCYELFIEKFNEDFNTAKKNLEEYQEIIDQFTYIKENEL